MIKLLIVMLCLTACANLNNETDNSNEFVVQENNSVRPIEFDYK